MKSYTYYAEYFVNVCDIQAEFKYLIFQPFRFYAFNHTHSYFELHYVTQGTIRYTMNFHDEITLSAGEWMLISPNVLHEEHILTPSSGYALGFALPVSESNSLFSILSNMTYYKGQSNMEFGDILYKIVCEAKEKRAEYESCCKNLIGLLLIQIGREITKSEMDQTTKQPERKNMYVMIDDYFNRVFRYDGKNLSINELACQLHMSPRHINRILLDYYGITFHEKLMATKVKFAELLLRTTDQTIGEISANCDVTAACLIENFKKNYGMTPAKYRKLNKTDMI